MSKLRYIVIPKIKKKYNPQLLTRTIHKVLIRPVMNQCSKTSSGNRPIHGLLFIMDLSINDWPSQVEQLVK